MIRLTAPFQFIVMFSRKLRDDYITSFAAETTLFMVISCFPFLMFVFSLLEHLPISGDSIRLICQVFLPATINRYAVALLDRMIPNGSGTVLATTAIAFLWAGSKGFLSLERGLNNVYSRLEKRNYFLRRFLSLIYTLLFALFLILVLVVFVFGNQIFARIETSFPSVANLAFLIKSVRTTIGIAVLTVLFTSMFLLIPNRRGQHSSFITELPGALFASIGWLVFSYLYSFYIDHMSNFSAIYGNLTAIVLCLLWLYICMYILFVGAEINGFLKLYEIRASILRRKRKEKNQPPLPEDTAQRD